MSSLSWYWHRLRAMRPAELSAHARRKIHQVSDGYLARRRFARLADLSSGSTFPSLPEPARAPEELREALRKDAGEIQSGQWVAFGYRPLQVDLPPRWHKDYLVGVDMVTRQRALKLHHRLEGKADIKLIWEPSRWYSLVRLAQAAYVLGATEAAAMCYRCLSDWVEQNPPYFGWHWTSGLESGIRLIQFVWIDALLEKLTRSSDAVPSSADGRMPFGQSANRWPQLRAAILVPHVWFTWRERSFGSSANNHVLGEFAGLILALVRWPELSRWAVSLDEIQPLWERQVLAQFAVDGGNQEQALNYHLFGWEFCWQARLALRAAGRTISPEVEDRLRMAASFFREVQVGTQPWDYGDSDNAFVTPFFKEWPNATAEWHTWLEQSARSPGIRFWLGEAPKPLASPAVLSGAKGWRVFPETGIAICRAGDWFLRWDLSPLGFLSTAGHGHCDALHLSIWFRGEPVVIDPGTGAYHSDRALRDYLSSWEAHNGPHPIGLAQPQRMGTFLWSAHHPKPGWKRESDWSMSAELALTNGIMRRTITRVPMEDAWLIDDAYNGAPGSSARAVTVLWQWAPGIRVESVAARKLRLDLKSGAIIAQFDDRWELAETGSSSSASQSDGKIPLGICSPAFRQTVRAPFVRLQALRQPAAALRTTLSCCR